MAEFRKSAKQFVSTQAERRFHVSDDSFVYEFEEHCQVTIGGVKSSMTEREVMQLLGRMEADPNIFNQLSPEQVTSVLSMFLELLNKWECDSSKCPNMNVLKWFQYYFLLMYMNRGVSITQIIQEQIEELFSVIQGHTDKLLSCLTLTHVMFLIGTTGNANNGLQMPECAKQYQRVASIFLSELITLGLESDQNDVSQTWIKIAQREYFNLFVPVTATEGSFYFLNKIIDEGISTFSDVAALLPAIASDNINSRYAMAQILELTFIYKLQSLAAADVDGKRLVDLLAQKHLADVYRNLSSRLAQEKSMNFQDLCTKIIDCNISGFGKVTFRKSTHELHSELDKFRYGVGSGHEVNTQMLSPFWVTPDWRKLLGETGTYTELREETAGLGDYVNVDHQPPFFCINDARSSSNLGKAFGSRLDATTRGHNLYCCIVPTCHHRRFLTTGNSHDAKFTRELITKSINTNKVVETFEYDFLASSPAFIYAFYKAKNREHELPPSMNPHDSTYIDYCKKGFQGIFQLWDNYFTNRRFGVIDDEDREKISSWISRKGYADRNDTTFNDFLQKLLNEADEHYEQLVQLFRSFIDLAVA